MDKIVTRFAPSPTGYLHLGGLRTALYNYLFAKANQGSFLLRIEDTDSNRSDDSYLEYIKEVMEWSGLVADNHDEATKTGFQNPFKQSNRFSKGGSMYKYLSEAISHLLDNDYAYWAYDTTDELSNARKAPNWSYNALTRMEMRNSLTIGELSEDVPKVLRFKMPRDGDVSFDDEIRGRITYSCDELDDKILVKSDGSPTYHLANVLDDHSMEVTHVIRGEEWIPSTPLHAMLYEALGHARPVWAHLPLILAPDGSKLSKRKALKYDIDVFPLECEFIDEKKGDKHHNRGYADMMPEALLNYLALLGWSPGEEEVVSIEEMISSFDLKSISKGGVRFDPIKLRSINADKMRLLSDDVLLTHLSDKSRSFLANKDQNLVSWLIGAAKVRSTKFEDLDHNVSSIIDTPDSYTKPKHIKQELLDVIYESIRPSDGSVYNWTVDNISKNLDRAIESSDLKPGHVKRCLRQVLTGGKPGPELEGIMALIGPNECLVRLENASKYISDDV